MKGSEGEGGREGGKGEGREGGKGRGRGQREVKRRENVYM